MNAIRTCYHAEPGHIMADITLSTGKAAVNYFTLGGQLPRIKHHQQAARILLDAHYPGWRTHHVLVTAWMCDNTYVHIAAQDGWAPPKAELSPEGQ